MEGGAPTSKLVNTYVGVLRGHQGEVTSIVSGYPTTEVPESRLLITGGRDKRILIWRLSPPEGDARGQPIGEPLLALTGHGHFISDLALTKDNLHLFSTSWDRTLRHWDVKNGKCISTFVGQGKEMTSVALSLDYRKVFTAGLENSLALWNIKGMLMENSERCNHDDWVSKVRYSPSIKNEYLVSAGWDGRLKVWVGNFQIKNSFPAHEGPITALDVAFNGLFIATGGRDQYVRIWSLKGFQEPHQVVKCNEPINGIAFSTHMRIFAVATNKKILVYSLDPAAKEPNFSVELQRGQRKFSSVAWSLDGKHLFCGCGNGDIVVHRVALA